MNQPDIYGFTDFRAWLAAWHAVRQSEDPAFTRTEVSHRLGLPRTRGYFSDVIAGKRVSETFLERFCELLDLPRAEERYFRTLVRFDQAETPEEKELALEQLVSLNRAPAVRLEEGSWRYYRDWRHGAVRALAGAGARTAEALQREAARLHPSFTPGKVRASLELLLELGLLEEGPDGLQPTEVTLASPPWGRDEVFRLLQAQQLDLVREALLHPGDGNRAVATNLVAVSSGAQDRIRQILERCRAEVRAVVHHDPEPADRVLLLANVLLPLHEVRP